LKKFFLSDYRHLSIIAVLNFLVIYSSTFISGYGYFIDEFYYIACANSPAFGYVDHPPLAPLLLMVHKFIFGESLFAIRFIAALASSITIFLSGIITRQLGGNRTSQAIAAFCILVSPLFATLGSFYSMNVFEPLLCVIAFYYLIRMVNEENKKLWIYLGVIFGLLLMNKHTAGLFIVFTIISILLTKNRKLLFSKYFFYCVLITLIIFLPNLIWQIKNNFPSLEFYINNVTRKNIPMRAMEYLIFNIMAYNPFMFIISIAGAIYLLFNEKVKKYKLLGILFFLTFLFFFITKNARVDRSAYAYIGVIPAGAIFTEYLIVKIKQKWIYPVVAFLMFSYFVFFIPLLMPFLSYENSAKLTNLLGFNTEIEKGKKPLIPQMIADRIGWQEKVDMVGKVYLSFPEDERNRIIIVAGNYGNAGSLELLGKKYGIKNVVCGHNNYFLWSKERLYGDIVLRLINKKYYADLKESYEIVDSTDVFFDNEYCSPHERELTVFICKNPKVPETELLEGRRFYY
jgi:hypothetical protein